MDLIRVKKVMGSSLCVFHGTIKEIIILIGNLLFALVFALRCFVPGDEVNAKEDQGTPCSLLQGEAFA